MWLSGCCGEFRHLQSHFILGNVMFKLVFILSLDDPAISTNNSLTLKNHKVVEHKLMVLNLGFLNVTQTQSSCEKSISQYSAKSLRLPPGMLVSSQRES